jgi:hypothetical protein
MTATRKLAAILAADVDLERCGRASSWFLETDNLDGEIVVQ